MFRSNSPGGIRDVPMSSKGAAGAAPAQTPPAMSMAQPQQPQLRPQQQRMDQLRQPMPQLPPQAQAMPQLPPQAQAMPQLPPQAPMQAPQIPPDQNRYRQMVMQQFGGHPAPSPYTRRMAEGGSIMGAFGGALPVAMDALQGGNPFGGIPGLLEWNKQRQEAYDIDRAAQTVPGGRAAAQPLNKRG